MNSRFPQNRVTQRNDGWDSEEVEECDTTFWDGSFWEALDPIFLHVERNNGLRSKKIRTFPGHSGKHSVLSNIRYHQHRHCVAERAFRSHFGSTMPQDSPLCNDSAHFPHGARLIVGSRRHHSGRRRRWPRRFGSATWPRCPGWK